MNDAGLRVSEEAMGPWHGAAKESVVAHFVAEAGGDARELAAVTTRINGQFEERLLHKYLSPDSTVSLIHPSLPAYFESLRIAGVKVGLNTGYPRVLQQARAAHVP